MVMLVHIASAKLEPRIRRAGLKPGASLFGGRGRSDGIYAFPVMESHTLTHQWTREIMKWRRQPLIGVYFRIPDEEAVLFGRFGGGLAELSAAQAVGVVRAARDPRGLEIVLRRPIRPREITRIAPLRGVIGWRHMPDAHARGMPCGCPACVIRGEPGGRKLRVRWRRRERELAEEAGYVRLEREGPRHAPP